MIVDLHAHYPMHLDPGLAGNPWSLFRDRDRHLRIRDYFRALGVRFYGLFKNYPSPFSGPRVRVEYMVEGRVGVALSVLYSFFDEAEHHPATGTDNLDVILRLAKDVEASIGASNGQATVAHHPAELQAALNGERLALVHCVEGGFHLLGETPEAVERAVDSLADHGVAYITLAHLIWRGIATGANAFPNMDDEKYARKCPQPPIGLTRRRGRAVVRAMVRRKVLIDLTHMSQLAVDETLDYLDQLDPRHEVPVYVTHSACRFGPKPMLYNLSRSTIERVGKRNGVIGLIFAEHQLYDGLGEEKRKDLPAAWAALRQHIERIHEITGSYDNVAFGSDFDGFIKPTLAGLRDMRDMAELEKLVRADYPAVADKICHENALRPLRSYWRGAP
jgi:microsomal dipeptidase-like Zn-dependent dipeptidase